MSAVRVPFLCWPVVSLLVTSTLAMSATLISASTVSAPASSEKLLEMLEKKEISILMPNVRPPQPETYFCTSIQLSNNEEIYAVGFTPNASMATAHHMLVFGCGRPGMQDKVWNCGDMAAKDPTKRTGPVCRGHQEIVYAWAKNAPRLQLPDGVAFHLGGNTKVRYLTLQVHYADVTKFEDGTTTDDSGVFISYTTTPQPRSAGVLLMGSWGYVAAHSVTHMETACDIWETTTLHPFAFRTHTHALGEVVSGWRVRYENGAYNWTLLGKMNPQLPQMFYPVLDDVTIQTGDIVAARCTMRSGRSWTTKVGATAADEMCNFYLMYWTEGAPLSRSRCFSWGPPFAYWHRVPMGLLRMFSYPWLTNIPDEEAASAISGPELRSYILGSYKSV